MLLSLLCLPLGWFGAKASTREQAERGAGGWRREGGGERTDRAKEEKQSIGSSGVVAAGADKGAGGDLQKQLRIIVYMICCKGQV